MHELKTEVDTAAMVLGYPVLAIVIVMLLWFAARLFRDITKIFDEMRYERWKRKNVERDWDNIEASWALEIDSELDEYPDPVQYFNHDTDVIPPIPWQRHDTADLSEVYNYQEELRNERS
jgi:hypothetical protein